MLHFLIVYNQFYILFLTYLLIQFPYFTTFFYFGQFNFSFEPKINHLTSLVKVTSTLQWNLSLQILMWNLALQTLSQG